VEGEVQLRWKNVYGKRTKGPKHPEVMLVCTSFSSRNVIEQTKWRSIDATVTIESNRESTEKFNFV
jgi:hypothetical protein